MVARPELSLSDLEARVLELEAELARERRVTQAIQGIAPLLSGAAFESTLESILAKIAEVLEADRTSIFFLGERGDHLMTRVLVDGEVQSIDVPLGEGIVGHVARTGNPIRVKDAYRDRRFFRAVDQKTGYRTRSLLTVPMRDTKGVILGVMQALNKRGGAFTREDERLLTTLATQVAVTIDNTGLVIKLQAANNELLQAKEQLQARLKDLEFLRELEAETAKAHRLEEIVEPALRLVIRATQASAGAVLLPDEITGKHALYFLDLDRSSRGLRSLLVKANHGFLGAVMSQGHGGRLQDISFDKESAAHLDRQMRFVVETGLAHPLINSDQLPFGAIAVYNHKGTREFTPEDDSLLQLVAANLSTAAQLAQSRFLQERSERLSTIGRLLSGVIHDFKTPLAVIHGYVQMMAAAHEEKQRAEYAQLVVKQFELIQQMQHEVLAFARGEKTILIRRVYLQKFMHGFTQALTPECERRGIMLVTHTDDTGVARFDEGKITRALQNLCRNALDAMEDRGGTLSLRVHRRENHSVVFTVSDTGPGISEDIKGRLFELFVTSGKREGTGLGLAVVKSILDEHHGSIELQTSSHGTSFQLVIPQPHE